MAQQIRPAFLFLYHPVGNQVLKTIAFHLKQNFADYGYVGRIGGDEFAVILYKTISSEELKEKLEQFQSNISKIPPVTTAVTCSIGVFGFLYPQDFQEIYAHADEVLYDAKASGRACYRIKP